MIKPMVDIDRLARKLAVLEERIETKKAMNAGVEDRVAAALDRLRADMARRDLESARRDKDNTRWIIGLWVSSVAVMAILIRWLA